MDNSLLDQFNSPERSFNLRPTMHLVKVYAPIISAVCTRLSKGLQAQEIQDLVSQIDGLINSVLSANKLPTPGLEWQRASIRNAILPLCIEDIESTGDIQADKWLPMVCQMTQSLKIQATQGSPNDTQAAQVKLALSDSATMLLSATESFSFLHPKEKFVKEVLTIVFNDARALCDSLENQFPTDEKSALMTNFLKNHTRLMISAIQSESARIGPAITREIATQNPDGLPLDGLLSIYQRNKDTLSTLVPSLDEGSSMPQSNGSTKVPSFLRPG